MVSVFEKKREKLLLSTCFVCLFACPCARSAEQAYYILCGSSYDRFLTTSVSNDDNLLQGTPDKDSAAVFYVIPRKKPEGPFKFKILMKEDKTSLCLARNEEVAIGMGSAQMGGGYVVKVSLEEGLEVADWESKPCKHNDATLAYDENTKVCQFVKKGRAEKEGKLWMHFKLERVEKEEAGDAYRAPRGMRVKNPIVVKVAIDSSDSEPEFGD